MTLDRSDSELFRLIKGMSRGEKRFFSMYANRYKNAKDKTYLQLFDVIEKQKKYDEEFIKKKFKNQSFVKQLHVTKNYLYNLILEALVQYNNKNKKALWGKLMEMQVLYEKGMYDVVHKSIFKIRKEAEEQNDFLAVLETLRWEKQLATIMQTLTRPDEITKIWELEQHYTALHTEVERYRLLTMEVHLHQTRYRMLQQKEKEKFRKMEEQSLFHDLGKPRSASAKWQLNISRGMYYLTIGDTYKANDAFAKAVAIMDANPAFKERNIGSALNTLGNYIVTAYLLKQYEKSLKAIKDAKDIVLKDSSIDMKRRAFRNYFIALGIYCDTGRMDEALEQINEMQAQIDSGEISLPMQQVFFYINAAAVFLFRGEYKKSLQYTNKVINFTGIDKDYSDIYYFGRVIEIINLLESGDFDLLEYRIKSFNRYAMKRNSQYKFEKAFINFIRRILGGTLLLNQRKLNTAFVELKDSLENIFKDPVEENAGRYFDFIGWLESKINNVSYAEMARRRGHSRNELAKF